jgi:hypothetical protein
VERTAAGRRPGLDRNDLTVLRLSRTKGNRCAA